MLINVAQILKEPIGSCRSLPVNVIVGGENKESFNITGSINLVRTDKGILATGKMQYRIQGICSRCLEPTEKTVEFKIEEEYLPTIDINTGLPLNNSNESFLIDNHHNLDVRNSLYQYACTALPMKYLCRENCAGICPSCGQNLNRGKCECRIQKQDDRWSKLLTLKKEGKINGTIT